MTEELYKRYRPKTLKSVVGQDGLVKVLSKKLKSNSLPHSILFSGPSGCGKTTLARILASAMECSDTDLAEMNCADIRGIDAVRDIRNVMPLSPISGNCRVWIIDEAHKLTSDAQNAFLKMLEDTPSHVYFFLCTTEAQKILKTIKTRCFPANVKSLTDKELRVLIDRVVKAEGLEVHTEVIDKIILLSEGSARQSLVLLEKVSDLTDTDEQIDVLEKADQDKMAIDVCRAMFNLKTTWEEMAAIIKNVDVDAEKGRRAVLGYANSILLGKAKFLYRRAFIVMQVFRDNWFDCGIHGLTVCAYEVFHSK